MFYVEVSAVAAGALTHGRTKRCEHEHDGVKSARKKWDKYAKWCAEATPGSISEIAQPSARDLAAYTYGWTNIYTKYLNKNLCKVKYSKRPQAKTVGWQKSAAQSRSCWINNNGA